MESHPNLTTPLSWSSLMQHTKEPFTSLSNSKIIGFLNLTSMMWLPTIGIRLYKMTFYPKFNVVQMRWTRWADNWGENSENKLIIVVRSLICCANLDDGSQWQELSKMLSNHIVQDAYWRQRENVHWMKDGDTNSKFFHASANARKIWKFLTPFFS